MDQRDPLKHVLDGLDVEVFFVCQSEADARQLMLSLLGRFGFQDVDVVFSEHYGPGARVRGRAYVRRPGVQSPNWGESV